MKTLKNIKSLLPPFGRVGVGLLPPFRMAVLGLLLILVGLISCNKDKTTSVDVLVTETGTTTPAVGIPVNFGYSSTGGVFSGQVVEQTKTTDANGKVSFKGQEENQSYRVGFPNGADYFGDGSDYLKEGHNRVFLHTSPFAYVRVHAKNVNPFDSNDRINIGGGGIRFME